MFVWLASGFAWEIAINRNINTYLRRISASYLQPNEKKKKNERKLTLLAKLSMADVPPSPALQSINWPAVSAFRPSCIRCGSGDKSRAPESRPHDSWPYEFLLPFCCKLHSTKLSAIQSGDSRVLLGTRFSRFCCTFRGVSWLMVWPASLIFNSRSKGSSGPAMPRWRHALVSSSASIPKSATFITCRPCRTSFSSFDSDI